MKNNTIQIGNSLIDFKYAIKETIETEGLVVVLLEIPYSDSEINNVYVYDKSSKELWRVDTRYADLGVKNVLPFEKIRYIDGKLYATDFYGRRFEIDLITGKTLSLKYISNKYLYYLD